MSTALIQISALQRQLAAIKTPVEAKRVSDQANKARELFKLLGASLEECNELAGIYILAYRKFGELVKDVPWHRPKKVRVDADLPGSEDQRTRARRFYEAVSEADIAEYLNAVNAMLEQASIAGCLGWLHTGRHAGNSGFYEWYTPPAIIEAARQVMGKIDLDPASCSEANKVVQAERYFTERDNGLQQHWHGRVFLNPPFTAGIVRPFAEKLLESLDCGDVEQGIWLSNVCSDLGWWQKLASRGVTCHHRGRLKFYSPYRHEQSGPPLGQTIIYFGHERRRFIDVFSGVGLCMTPALRGEGE